MSGRRCDRTHGRFGSAQIETNKFQYFGTREFPVEFQLWQESGDPVGFEHGHRDLGYMLYDFDYRNPAHPAPLFFRAELDDGVLDVESVEVRS